MATERSLTKDIRAAFAQAGQSRLEKSVLSKCVALATTLHISHETLVTCWEAFSLTHKVSELTNHSFDAYQAQVYKHVNTVSAEFSDSTIHSRSTKRQCRTHIVTPPMAKRLQRVNQSPLLADAMDFKKHHSLPLSSSDVAKYPPLLKYNERDNAGEVVFSFNPKCWPAISHIALPKKVCCVVSGEEFATNITEPYRHMFSVIPDRSQALEDQLVRIGEQIINKYGICTGENGIAPLEQVNVPRQEEICCVGRICNEAHEGQLNYTSVLLEGSSTTCGGARVLVDLSHFKASKQPYSLFPGQIVAIQGMNLFGQKIDAHRIYEGVSQPPCSSTVGQLRAFHHDAQDGKPVKLMTASGPFTTSDSMSYQPLIDFLHIVMEVGPDVVVLTGPFVDVRREEEKDGGIVVDFVDNDDNTIEQIATYEAVFATKVSALIEEIFAGNEALQTQFVLVPSLDDATAKSVYPQPPLTDGKGLPVILDICGSTETGTMGIDRINKGRQVPGVHCMSNPCTFRVNEITIGVTSTDVLFHISTEEINANLEPGSRLRRIAQHMLTQQSFYPLFPPPISFPVNLDMTRMKNWLLPCTPDIMIVPSKLTSFASTILDNTVFINPGHITRGLTGGTYGIMEVHPIPRGVLELSGGEEVLLPHCVPDRIYVEIKRV